MRVAIALFCLSGPAVAAPSRSDFSVNDTRAVAYDYATCIVKRRAAKAREVILANYDNATILKRYAMLVGGDCLVKATSGKTFGDVRMQLTGDMLRYGLADALFAAELAAVSPRNLSDTEKLEHRTVVERDFSPGAGKKPNKRRIEALEKSQAVQVFSAALSRFGECVVRWDGASAHALLTAKPSTAGEAIAFRRLQPAFSTCLTAGDTFKTNRTMMRGAVAINYYRLAFAPKAESVQ